MLIDNLSLMVYYPLTMNNQPPMINDQWFTINDQPSMIDNQSISINHEWSIMNEHTFHH